MFGVREFGFPPDLQNDCEVVLARASNGVSGTGICCAGVKKTGERVPNNGAKTN